MRCDACPVPEGASCRGECPGAGKLCSLVRSGNPSTAALVLATADTPCPKGSNPSPIGDKPPPIPRPEEARVLRPVPPPVVRKAVAACPYRERGCGCRLPRCAHPDFGPRHGELVSGAWRVRPSACHDCVANLARGLPAPATPPG